MALNVAVYVVWQVSVNDAGLRSLMSQHFLLHMSDLTELRPWTLLTSEISHIDPMHLFGNMLALYVFGGAILPVVGQRGLLQLYVVGALVASVAYLAWSWIAGDANSALGASGAVSGIAVVYGVLFPKRTLLLNFLIPVPAALAVGGYLLWDVWGVIAGGDNIAHAAHLGGAVYGAVYALAIARPRLNKLMGGRRE